MERDQIPLGMIDGVFCPLVLGDLPERLPFPWAPPPFFRQGFFHLADPKDASASLYDRLHHFDIARASIHPDHPPSRRAPLGSRPGPGLAGLPALARRLSQSETAGLSPGGRKSAVRNSASLTESEGQPRSVPLRVSPERPPRDEFA